MSEKHTETVYGVFDCWDYFMHELFGTQELAEAWIMAQDDRILPGGTLPDREHYSVEPLEMEVDHG